MLVQHVHHAMQCSHSGLQGIRVDQKKHGVIASHLAHLVPNSHLPAQHYCDSRDACTNTPGIMMQPSHTIRIELPVGATACSKVGRSKQADQAALQHTSGLSGQQKLHMSSGSSRANLP